MKKIMLLLFVLSVAGLVTSSYVVNANMDVMAMKFQFDDLVRDLNQHGRVPTTGVTGGFINNIWQSTMHSDDPGALGCGGQAEFVRERLSGVFPSWSFALQSEIGVRSPILLPHTWVRAYGPRGETVDIDPWLDSFVEE